jgi:hypothetical protein
MEQLSKSKSPLKSIGATNAKSGNLWNWVGTKSTMDSQFFGFVRIANEDQNIARK